MGAASTRGAKDGFKVCTHLAARHGGRFDDCMRVRRDGSLHNSRRRRPHRRSRRQRCKAQMRHCAHTATRRRSDARRVQPHPAHSACRLRSLSRAQERAESQQLVPRGAHQTSRHPNVMPCVRANSHPVSANYPTISDASRRQFHAWNLDHTTRAPMGLELQSTRSRCASDQSWRLLPSVSVSSSTPPTDPLRLPAALHGFSLRGVSCPRVGRQRAT